MKKIAIGIMSGTSLDGIDVVITEISGTGIETEVCVINAKTYQYDSLLLKKIKQLIDLKTSTADILCSVHFELAEAYSNYVKDLCSESQIKFQDVSFIASHGQTIYHIDRDSNHLRKSSLQLGDGSVLANLTGITTVSNFRTADIAVGGTGAPLVPYADFVLFRDSRNNRLLQNIGGIANVTILEKACRLEDVYAFDNGPGNMMIDEAMLKLYKKKYDNNGDVGRSGNVISSLFSELMSHKYLKQQPPKSTGRELFGVQYTDVLLDKYSKHKNEDIICTLTHFTAKSISDSYHNFIKLEEAPTVIVSGGGAMNKYLLELIQSYSGYQVKTLEDYNMDSNYKEAIAFVILGNETIHHQPSNVLKATGAKKYVILGQISPVLK